MAKNVEVDSGDGDNKRVEKLPFYKKLIIEATNYLIANSKVTFTQI